MPASTSESEPGSEPAADGALAGDVSLTLASLHVYPLKSCAGVSVARSGWSATGLALDRVWAVIDGQGHFQWQGGLPRMTLIQPRWHGDASAPTHLSLQAPGMASLHIAEPLQAPMPPARLTKGLAADDMGDDAARWLSEFLGRPLRLVRFDAQARHDAALASMQQARAGAVYTAAAPLHLISRASLAELNRRLAAQPWPAATLQRFRPNLVVDGLEAHDEDHIDTLSLVTPTGIVRLQRIAPCVRCAIPNVDPVTAEVTPHTNDMLARYRADARAQGAVTFGIYLMAVEGMAHDLHVGLAGSARYAF